MTDKEMLLEISRMLDEKLKSIENEMDNLNTKISEVNIYQSRVIIPKLEEIRSYSYANNLRAKL